MAGQADRASTADVSGQPPLDLSAAPNRMPSSALAVTYTRGTGHTVRRRRATPLGYSTGQPTTCLLHRWQRRLRPRQRPRTDVNPRRLSGDRDVLARRWATTLVRLLSGLDAHRQLHQPQLANPYLPARSRAHRARPHPTPRAPASRLSLAQLRTIRKSRQLCLVRATTPSQAEPRPWGGFNLSGLTDEGAQQASDQAGSRR